jgi:hypothetical protein
MKNIFWCLLFLYSITSNAQLGINEWEMLVPSKKAIDLCQGGNRIMVALENAVFEYDIINHEKTIWSKTNHLSDIFLNCVHYDSLYNSFWIGYSNGNIDRIKGETVNNLPDLKISSITGDKKVIKFISYKKTIFALTSFGILAIDSKKFEIKDTYQPNLGNSKIVDATILNDTMFVLTNNQLFFAPLNSTNLSDSKTWLTDTRIKNKLGASTYTSITHYQNQLFFTQNTSNFGNDSLFQISNNQVITVLSFTNLGSKEIVKTKTENNKLSVITYDGIYFLDQNLEISAIVFQYDQKNQMYPTNYVFVNQELWVSDIQNALVHWINNYRSEFFKVIGPPKSSFFTMDWKNGKLAIAGGTLQKAVYAYNNAGVYTFENDVWKLYDKSTITKLNNKLIWDFSCVSINPNNTKQFAFGTRSKIPLTIIDESMDTIEIYDVDNSILQKTSMGDGWSCVADLKYDNEGNLWVLNSLTTQPLKVFTKDKQWFGFETGSSSKNTFAQKLIIDYQNNKWFTIPGTGVIGFSDNNTIDNPSDDKYRLINDGLTSGALASREITAIAIDFDNQLWIGTDNGFAIVYNASSIIENESYAFTAQRIKLQYEGNVEYLLGNTTITDIVVDGGNRKWLATANAGLFLLSSDGSEIIKSFTTSNSPLISNSISDLQYNSSNGELYIITNLGFITMRTDATYEDPNYESVNIFPNPYKLEHSNGIAIQGIKYDSDIKITDVAGNVVYKTTSNGGTATWNAKTVNGERVASGIYFIWTAPNDGSGRKVGKVIVQ